MNEIGFKKHGRHYIHPDCKHLFVEFPGGPPLGIGEDNTIVPDEVEVSGTIIKILSPTDCVKDRLASYIHFKALEGIDQAVLVAKNQDVNLSSIKKWCKNEKAEWVFRDFINKLRIEAPNSLFNQFIYLKKLTPYHGTDVIVATWKR